MRATPRRGAMLSGATLAQAGSRWFVSAPRGMFTAVFLALTASSAPGSSAADLRSVSERVAVLYDAPSRRAKKIYVVGQFYPVEIVVNLDNWVKVRDVSGELTWMEKKSLSEKRTVIVTVAMADVRQAADEKSVLVFQAREGVILELFEIGAAGWVRVQHRDGQGGYVNSKQVWGL